MMMSKSGDSNLNRFAQAFGESAMASLKQTILEQEHIFRNQVRELHRLYWTQKNLMKELRENGLNVQIGNSFNGNEGGDLFRNHRRNFDLQLPADAFISIDLNNSLLETDRPKVNGKFDVEKRLLSSVDSEIIDLEDSIDLDRHEKENEENNAYCAPSMVHFGEAKDGRLEEHMAHDSCAGIDDSSLDSVTDHSRITHESWTVLFDLNKPLRDSEVVHKSSQGSMLAGNYTKNYNDIESSKLDINVLSSAYPVEGSIASTDGDLNGTPTPISSLDLSKQEEGGASPSNKLRLVPITDNNRQDSNITSSNSMNLLQTLTRDPTEKQRNHEESETLSGHEDDEDRQTGSLGKDYVRCNPNGLSECSSYENAAREPASLSITDDSVITSSHTAEENEMSCFGKLESEEQDVATKAAAQTLMAITRKNFDVSEVTELLCEEDKSDQLQVSSESFEAMTMRLAEIQNDEVMPEVPRLDVRERDEVRVRPKRGKRIRNFQKEVLPGLVSLSRHEICEDLYSINSKFRRNGFRAEGNSFVPVRSRRSRRYSGPRRRRSFRC